MDESVKEREILKVMRKVMSSVICEITPPPGARHPLSEKTIEDVRMCLGLISSRERELAEQAGVAQERPHFTDEVAAARVIPMNKIGKRAGEGSGEDT